MAKSKVDALSKLPQQYQKLVSELDDADVYLLLKHLPNHNAHREFANLVELGIDLAGRRKEIEDDPEKKLYGSKLTSTFSAVLGIPDSTIQHVTRSVEVMGGPYLRQLAVDAHQQGIKLTYSHIRELNRLSTDDWLEARQAIISQLFSGEIVTHRQVTAAVDALLGVVRTTTVNYVDSDDGAEVEKKALPRTPKQSAAGGDALGDIAMETDVDKLCVQLVDIINQADKKFDDLYEKLRTWRADVPLETIQSMCLDSVDIASTAANDFAVKVKDTGLILDGVIELARSVNSEV